MEKCTAEVAQGFAKAGEEGEEGEEAAEGDKKEEAKKPAKPTPASTGAFSGDLRGGVEKGSIKLTVKDDFSVMGTARITNEGRTVPVVVRGKVADDKKSISAEGSSGKTDVKVNATIKGTNINGALSGKVFGKSFKSKFTASK